MAKRSNRAGPRRPESHAAPGRNSSHITSATASVLNNEMRGLLDPLIRLCGVGRKVQLAVAAGALVQSLGGRLHIEDGGDTIEFRVAFDLANPVAAVLLVTQERAALVGDLLLGFLRGADALGQTIAFLRPDVAHRILERDQAMAEAAASPARRPGERAQ